MSGNCMTYETLGNTHPATEEVGEFTPPKKMIESEMSCSLTLSINNRERSLKTHKIFHHEKSLRNQDMVRWERHSLTFTNLVERVIEYTYVNTLLAQ